MRNDNKSIAVIIKKKNVIDAWTQPIQQSISAVSGRLGNGRYKRNKDNNEKRETSSK